VHGSGSLWQKHSCWRCGHSKLLAPGEFVECIVRMAAERYPRISRVADRVEMVIENHLLRFCSTSDPTEFRTQVASEAFQV